MQEISKRILDGERISGADFLHLAAEADIYQLGFLADAVRKRLCPADRLVL